MLKIIDDYDLKQLEKFGYKKIECDYSKSSMYIKEIFCDRYIGDCGYIVVCGGYIQLEKRTNAGLKFIANDEQCKRFILDLIQAGLVEVVD